MMVWDGWHSMFFLAALFQIFVLAAVVYAIVVLVRRAGRRTGSTAGALKLLEERYARGEIERDEFLERRRVLGG